MTYGSAVNQSGQTVTLKLDVYGPTGDTVTSRPAIVWVHGGSFSGGDKTSAELVDESNIFAKKGYVNVSINYRLSPDGCSANAPTRQLRASHHRRASTTPRRPCASCAANAATYGVDTDRIAIGGTSAGAITALNVGFNPDDPAEQHPGPSSAVRGAVSLSGAKILGAAGPATAASLLFHGTADPLVPYQWAVNTVNEARGAGL